MLIIDLSDEDCGLRPLEPEEETISEVWESYSECESECWGTPLEEWLSLSLASWLP